MSRHLIGAQRGRIGATSLGLGEGPTFFVTLPVASDSSASSADA